MFAYCNNNPVVRHDFGGCFWETVFDVISLGASIVEVAINPGDPWAWAGLVGDTLDLIPFVTGVGEVTRAVKTTVKVVDKADDVIDAAKTIDNVGDAAKQLRRPYIRKSTRDAVEAATPKLPDGRFINVNIDAQINGKYDVGHVTGHEFWYERDLAMAKGMTQKQFNDYMNDPFFYRIEDPISNRSHKFEMRR